jgi:hypothetical protein
LSFSFSTFRSAAVPELWTLDGITHHDTTTMKTQIQSLLLLGALALVLTGCATIPKISQEQLEGVRKAAQKVLPAGAEVSVTTQNHIFYKPDVIISAYLLFEGYSADESSSPYVRGDTHEKLTRLYGKGDYGPNEKLARLVRFRCAKILRSLVSESQVPDAGRFAIEARYDCRLKLSYNGVPAKSGIGSDTDTNLYTVTVYSAWMPAKQMRDPKWSELTDEQVMARWYLWIDEIPSLRFSSSQFGF